MCVSEERYEIKQEKAMLWRRWEDIYTTPQLGCDNKRRTIATSQYTCIVRMPLRCIERQDCGDSAILLLWLLLRRGPIDRLTIGQWLLERTIGWSECE
jgi:hypothetical protein